MLLSALVETSAQVTATSSRLAKRAALATLLGAAEPADVEIVVAYLAGELRQRRTGIGWAALRLMPVPAAEPVLTVQGVDAQLQRISELAGPGSAAARATAVTDLLGAATPAEQDFLRRLISGEIRQGALDSTMLDAVAVASGVAVADLRRAVMLRGATGPVALAALTGGVAEVAGFALTVGRPVRPMLASTEPDVAAALARIGAGQPAVIDTKLDGIRIQAHKDGASVRLFTRSLDEITARLPEVAAAVAALDCRRAVLDGEAIAVGPDGRPRPFQETSARSATRSGGPAERADPAGPAEPAALSVFFFDCLLIDDDVLLDEPLSRRLERLDALLPESARTARLTTSDVAAAVDFAENALRTGHEGVVVKAPDSRYDAGRRGASWIKVKPRHTLDLVVLAVEWGSGRRRGLLSNIHLGARDGAGGWVMLGKTFKGMTDEMLTWQTQRFLELETGRAGHVVTVRPEQVVEIAIDGLQRSTRYPGGVALRFARVVRYRDDKRAEEADTIDTVRGLFVE